MDDARFDALARSLSRPHSRRSVLATFVAAVATLRRPATAAPSCGSPSAKCLADANAALANDRQTCEDQGADCSGACDEPGCFVGCLTGILKCRISASAAWRAAVVACGGCPEGVCCGGSCVDPTCSGDLVFDGRICQCRCPPGTCAAASGGAVCFTKTCPGAQVPDPANCACACPGVTCPQGQAPDPSTCRCRCPAVTCPQGQAPDPANCQCRCTTPCPTGQTQDPQTCACDCGGASCTGACCGGRCTDTRTDPANCGGCGIACPGGRKCRDGKCACPPENPDLCEGICTNFKRDPFACGGCGAIYRCPKTGPLGLPHCCPGTGIGTGICTNIWSDGANCGGCGHACGEGEACVDAVCQG